MNAPRLQLCRRFVTAWHCKLLFGSKVQTLVFRDPMRNLHEVCRHPMRNLHETSEGRGSKAARHVEDVCLGQCWLMLGQWRGLLNADLHHRASVIIGLPMAACTWRCSDVSRGSCRLGGHESHSHSESKPGLIPSGGMIAGSNKWYLTLLPLLLFTSRFASCYWTAKARCLL